MLMTDTIASLCAAIDAGDDAVLPILADALEDASRPLLAAAIRSGDQQGIWSRIVLHGDVDLPSPGWLRFGVGCDVPHASWVVSCRLPLWAATIFAALDPEFYYVALRDDCHGEPCPVSALGAETLGMLLVADAFGLAYGSPTSWHYGQVRNLPCELTSLRPGRRAKAIGTTILAALAEALSHD